MRFAQFVAAILAALAFIFPASAQAACNSERLAFAEEWKTGELAQLPADQGLEILDRVMTKAPEWASAADLARIADEMTSGAPPAATAYMKCRIRERIAELGGVGKVQSGAPGMSSFASGSGEEDPGTQAATSGPANCELRMGDVHSGALSTDSATLHNTCTSKVVFVYCITSANGGGSFSCDRGKFGTDSIAAGGTGYLSIAGASQPFEAHWFACVADEGNKNPFPSRPSWDGTNIHAICN